LTDPEHGYRASDIAVIGMACLFPGAEGLEQFWRNIRGKEIQIGEPQPGWGAERHLSGTGATRISTAAGGYLRELYRFDPSELGVMPNSVDGGEPDQFIALKLARDALADAGCLDNYDHANTGVIIGHSSWLHRGSGNMVQHGVVVDQTIELVRQLIPDAPADALEKLRAAFVAQLPPFNADTVPGFVPNIMTGRIANRFDLRGPNYILDAACASSLLAVKAAMEELRNRRSDLMLAGGVNASISSISNMVFTQLGGLSPRSQIKPFDAEADGTLLAEGAGIIVLKRMDDALAASDRIYAVFNGIGQSSDGRGGGILAPRISGEVAAIRRAYVDAGCEPEDVELLEAHGTGIPLGDRTEVAALHEVFGERERDLPRIALGTIKSMIGHCIPAAGIAGLIKAILALHYRVLPPMICNEVNPTLGIDQTRLYVNTQARPWISSGKIRRRAGVNAFGFGGINSHAVLEEAPEPADGFRPAHLAAELVVLSASSSGRLLEVIDGLRSSLAGPLAQEPLASLAAALAAKSMTGTVRLAVVADDISDLMVKLARARERIAAGNARFHLLSGVYCSDKVRSGKLAFVFPGEGSQYTGMLTDVLEAFPEARKWFDFWDGLYSAELQDRPSEAVFPPSKCLSESTRERLENNLFGIEMGSESVFIASHALYAVTSRVGLRPDVLVGHSSGEHAALSVAGALGWTDLQDLEMRIGQLKRLFHSVERSSELAGGALLAVGAAPRERTVALAEQAQAHVALDNCDQQIVLYGHRSQLDSIAAQLGAEGGLCAFLPFSRPYHTPLFAPRVDLESIYQSFNFQTPAVPLYSCATAELMPSAPDEIRRLVAAQWRSRVRFSETIKRMYADGVRTFVEIGASANLTGFIDNILRSEDQLAVAFNGRRRSGLVHLLHALGRLWSEGVSLDIHKLYEGRPISPSSLSGEHPRTRRGRVVPNELPFVQIPAQTLAEVRAALTPQSPHAVAKLNAGDAVGVAAAPHASVTPDYPFLDRVVASDADGLVAECDLDLRRHPFLRQHCLCANEVSDLYPELVALPVVPLSVSMELLAEVAVASVGALIPIRLEGVRAHNWITVEDGVRTIRLEATPISKADGLVRVNARICDPGGGMPFVEACVVLAEEVGIADSRDLHFAPLADRRAPVWSSDELYRTGMFHGPMFHSVETVLAWDDAGLEAHLAHTPLDNFFSPDEQRRPLLNPILLDAIGHLTAFWICQYIGPNFSCFPSSIKQIDLYNAAREDTGGGFLAGRIAFEQSGAEPWYLSGEFTCFAADGAPLFRATGWRDRFFEMPENFCRARGCPRDEFYGEEVSEFFRSLPERTLVWRIPAFPAKFLDTSGGIWRRVLSRTVLSTEEREYFRSLLTQQRRADEWLIGRLALKEAARAWFVRYCDAQIYPADLVIRVTPDGKPYLAADGLEVLAELPELSVSHVEGEAVAVAAPRGQPVGIDLEKSARIHPQDLLMTGFSEAEQALFTRTATDQETSVLQAWCAKEAAAKCVGTGLKGQPRSFVVSAMDVQQGWANVLAPGHIALYVSLGHYEGAVLAVAFADDFYKSNYVKSPRVVRRPGLVPRSTLKPGSKSIS
jgi:acyl transferase domain-containing protein/phosphopantetheinyl transferase